LLFCTRGLSLASRCFTAAPRSPNTSSPQPTQGHEMSRSPYAPNRRLFLGALGTTLLTSPALFAAELLRTPSMTERPFYPDKIPLDDDNDLIIVGKNTTQAVGEVTHLTGKVLDINGTPVKNALVEIWQCDANAVYLHSSDSGPKAKQQDKNFQGFGRCT